MLWKWDAYAVDNVIMEVSAITVQCQAISQPFPHCLEYCCGHERLSFAVDKVSPPQDLSVEMKHGWHNVIPEQAQIPARNKYKSVYTIYM